MGEKTEVTKAAGQISIATTVSRILGFIRDVILARMFGATGMTDAFFVAYRIPNLLRELFAEGAVSAGFVPVFAGYLSKDGREEAEKLAGVVFAFLLSVLLVVCLLGIIFAPAIASVAASGFLEDPAKFHLTIQLMRIMFPFLLFISLAALVMGVLNSLRSFFLPALAPAFFNLAIIASALFLSPRFQVPILAVGIGVTAGGALQFGVQISELRKRGFRVIPSFSFAHPGLKKIILLVIPVVAAIGATQINVLISNIFATYLPAGSATYLYYGIRLVLLPIGIFGVAMAMAVLPSMSEQAVAGDIDALRETFSFSLRLVFFLSIPAMAGLVAMAEPIINLLYQRGEFTYEATGGTVTAMLYYAAGLWAFVGSKVVRAPFYSMQDTITPLKVAVISVLTNAFFSVVLIGPMKHGGLALSLSLAAAVNFVLLFLLLRAKLGRVDGKKILRSCAKTCFASLVMGGAGWFLLGGDMWTESGMVIQKTVRLSSAIAFCIVLYLLMMRLMKSEELGYLLAMRRKERSSK